MAGANSLFYGEKLLTAANPKPEHDIELFKRLGIQGEEIAAADNEMEERDCEKRAVT